MQSVSSENLDGFFKTSLPSTSMHRGFSEALLSLRGLAASMVLVFHGFLTFQVSGANPRIFVIPSTTSLGLCLDEWIIFLTNGGAAVTFFFVHSGFVLALSLDKAFSKASSSILAPFGAFYIRRIFRLYPIIFFAVGCGFILSRTLKTLPPPEATSTWYNAFYPLGSQASWGGALLDALTIGGDFNKFAWSLRLEFLLSLLMPFLFLALRRIPSTILLFLVILIVDRLGLFQPGGYAHGYFITFTACFITGCALTSLAPYAESLKKRLKSGSVDALVLVSFIIMVSVRPLIGPQHRQVAILVETLASAPIIYTAYYLTSGRFYDFLNLAFTRYLGRVSYSLYMVSTACIYIAGRLAAMIVSIPFAQNYGLAVNALVTLIAYLLALAVSGLTYAWIEAPSMEAGKNLGLRLEAWLNARPPNSIECDLAPEERLPEYLSTAMPHDQKSAAAVTSA